MRCLWRSDSHLCSILAYIRELWDSADVDQSLRRGKPELHQRNEAVSARKYLCAASMFLEEVDGFSKRCRNRVLEVLRNHDAFLPFRIFQIFSDRRGMSMCEIPKGARASTTALTTAGAEPIVHAPRPP